jgi:FAD-dependent urate hydroxylase
MKALVIGGGIGGPLAALGLKLAGFEPVIFEAREHPEEYRGLFLGLGANGMRALRRLGVLDAVLEVDTIATPSICFSSSSGKRLGTVSNGGLDDRTPCVTLMRGALQRALLEEARSRGIEIRHGKRLTSYEETETHVEAHFADRTTHRGDVLIGADGIRSVVRKLVDPSAPDPSFTGLLNVGGVAFGTSIDATPGTMHMVWGRRAFFGYTVRQNGDVWWFANLGSKREPARDELAGTPTAVWQQRLQDAFAGDPELITRIVRSTSAISAHPIHDMPTVPRWHRGRAVLIGDAAHAVSPSTGQGASLAMEDAIVLARCLRDLQTPERAIPRYEQLRRERAEKIIAVGRRRGAYKAPGGPVARFFRDLFMPLALRLFATERSTAWIYDYDVPWGPREAAT